MFMGFWCPFQKLMDIRNLYSRAHGSSKSRLSQHLEVLISAYQKGYKVA